MRQRGPVKALSPVEVDDVADDPALVRSEKGNHSVNVRRLSNQPFTLPSLDGSVKGERASRKAQRCQEFAFRIPYAGMQGINPAGRNQSGTLARLRPGRVCAEGRSVTSPSISVAIAFRLSSEINGANREMQPADSTGECHVIEVAHLRQELPEVRNMCGS